MTEERRGIESRLENWARWANSGDRGPRAAACMTGAICDAMEKAKNGGISVPGGDYVIRSIDTNDAVLIGRAMVRITLGQRRLLGMHYVDGQRAGYTAALLRFPPLEYDRRMADAQGAVERVIAPQQANACCK